MIAPRSPGRRPPDGFTVVELTIVSGLMTLLALLLAASWRGFCRPAFDAASRCRIAQEANLAAAALARDLGGSLSNPEGRLGPKTNAVFVGRMQPSPTWLRLCFHGGSDVDLTPKWSAPDTLISYQAQGDALVRWDENAGTTVTVAKGLSAFSVVPLELDNGVAITMTFSDRDVSLTYAFIALDPPKP
ncbi:MAG: hypothetical protein ACHRXM_36660 [Isosphaerales bacterium]